MANMILIFLKETKKKFNFLIYNQKTTSILILSKKSSKKLIFF